MRGKLYFYLISVTVIKIIINTKLFTQNSLSFTFISELWLNPSLRLTCNLVMQYKRARAKYRFRNRVCDAITSGLIQTLFSEGLISRSIFVLISNAKTYMLREEACKKKQHCYFYHDLFQQTFVISLVLHFFLIFFVKIPKLLWIIRYLESYPSGYYCL